MPNFSIEIKIIIAIIFFTLSLASFERYKFSQNIVEQFVASKKSENKLLSNTIAPIIGINLFLGLDNANRTYLDQIVKQNVDVEYIKLTKVDGDVIYNSSIKENLDESLKIRDNMNFYSQDIVDTLTGEKSATLELYFLNSKYQQFLKKNRETAIEIFAVTFTLLVLFTLWIKRKFRHLNELSKKVLSYDPTKSNITLTKTDRLDEVGVIHNAIVLMEKRINSHTQLLDETNALLEEKVKLRTVELDELNQSLKEKISLTIKNLDDKNKLMMQQSRLAQMGEMISMIAHQWRQPLSTISTVANNLLIKIQLNKYDEHYFIEKLTSIDAFTQHLSSTINDFKNFFEPTNEKKEVTYNEIITDSLNIINSSISDNKIKITKQSTSNKSYLTYDNELKQVLINLITNAKDALLEQEIEHPEILIETLLIDDKEVLRVSDNGGGIPDDIIFKIFDPYFSTKKNKNGTGLGLYMSKMIIEEHCKGKLIVYNNEKGAVFEIRLQPKEEQ